MTCRERLDRADVEDLRAVGRDSELGRLGLRARRTARG